MRIPILPTDRSYISFIRIILFCLYYTIILHFIAILYSMGYSEFTWESQWKYPSLIIFSFIICLIVTLITIPISSFVIDIVNFSDDHYVPVLFAVTATLNSFIYLIFYYLVWSSGDYPLDLFRVLMIVAPFYLAALVCLIF